VATTYPVSEIRKHGEAALKAIDQLPDDDSAKTRKILAEVLQQFVQMRDGLIAARRCGEAVTHWLTQVNALISSIFGTEFPINGFNKSRVDETRTALEHFLSKLSKAELLKE
jgi:hypothetical protein